MNRLASLAVLGVVLAAQTSQAIMATTWNAVMSGSYDSSGAHGLYNQNYSASDDRRNFFVFALNAFGGGAQSVTLTLNTGVGCSGGTFTLHGDVTTDPYRLNFSHGVGEEGQQIYQDLGDGVIFGSWTIPGADNLEVVLELNSLGVAAINNAAGGWITFGGTFSGHSAFGQTMLYGRNDVRQLTTYSAIPEPGILSLLLAGAPCVAGACRNRRKRFSPAKPSESIR